MGDIDIIVHGAQIVSAALFGLCLGSFATMLSHRLPRGEEIVRTRSHCPACGHALGVRDLVPVFSWLVQRGRCRHCGAAVPARYPLIELIVAALCAAAGARWGLGVGTAAVAVLATLLVTLAVIDIEEGLLPQGPVLALALVGVAWRAYDGGADGVTAGLLSALLYGAAAWGLSLIARTLVGRAEIRLFAACGVWAGAAALPLFLTTCGIAGLLWRLGVRRGGLPLVPPMAAALMLCVLAPELATLAVAGD